MNIIWNYELEFKYEQTHYLPLGYKILSVQQQRGKICVWVQIDPDRDTQEVTFFIRCTGDEIKNSKSIVYLNTVQMDDGLVWHVFKEKN